MREYMHFDTKSPDGVRVTFTRQEAYDHDASPLDWMNESDPDDAERIKGWRSGDWHFIGIRAAAEVAVIRNGVGTGYQLTSAGLWGIESDSGEEYLTEVYRQECDSLKSDIDALRSLPVTYGEAA